MRFSLEAGIEMANESGRHACAGTDAAGSFCSAYDVAGVGWYNCSAVSLNMPMMSGLCSQRSEAYNPGCYR